MVVVAGEGIGDVVHDIPLCNVTKDKDSHRTVPELEDCSDPNKMKTKIKIKKTIVVVAGEAKFPAKIIDTENNLIADYSVLLMAPNSIVSQVRQAVSICCKDSPSIDKFNLYLTQGENHFPLDDMTKTLDDYGVNFDSPKVNEASGQLTFERHNNDCKYEYSSTEDVYLEFKLYYEEQKHLLNISFLVSKATWVEDLIANIKEHVNFLFDNKNTVKFTLLYSGISISSFKSYHNTTIGEFGFDFSKSAEVILKLRVCTTPNWEDSHSPTRNRRNASTTDGFDYSAALRGADDSGLSQNKESDSRPTSNNKTVKNEMERFSPSGNFSGSPKVERKYVTERKSDISYVGLVNQAMTCYLNSLLQALYMTPEFRNALYNWEYVEGSEKDEANSIPYQLQKLFLNLQTSQKTAVETTSLTKSFGWDSTEAWQQHDIQELCRVMFDALEQKFKNTEQADLINRFYEGKMIDYVKCLECQMEKSREDTFLDIPLPVKPFGSTVAYNSVEEALRGFVQPETLNDTNQYFCENCNKKCDAHKGLKFTKFPYLLTLHLKRFDFDYQTFHRIKLNDKVTFPDILNLNSLIPSSASLDDNEADSPLSEEVDECLPCENGFTSGEPTPSSSEQNDDEGIDMNNASTSSVNSQENDRNRNNKNPPGPYKYELFSIMIHSGSAGGGHYYAYIKDFKTQEWLCFNDQNVSPITHDDIQKSYGGGPSRVYYSGAYSSSTNAYMLMYRQIDPERNALPMQVNDFPKHIQEVLRKMKEQEERRNAENSMNYQKFQIFCHHPKEKKRINTKIYLFEENESLSDLTKNAYDQLNLKDYVDLNQCRLVAYDPEPDFIQRSFEGAEQKSIASITQSSGSYQTISSPYNLLMEIKNKNDKFKVYHPGEIATKVFLVNVNSHRIVDGPVSVRVKTSATLTDYCKLVAEAFNQKPFSMHIVLMKNNTNSIVLQENDSHPLEYKGFTSGCKVFVSSHLDSNPLKKFTESTLKAMVESFANIIVLNIELPDMRNEVLKELNIQLLESKKEAKDEKVMANGLPISKPVVNGESGVNAEKHDIVDGEVQKSGEDEPTGWNSLQAEGEEWQERSTSEDSSLSDSDRTLVGDASEDDETSNVIQDLFTPTRENWGVDDQVDYCFKVKSKPGSSPDQIQLLVDQHITMESLRKHLEQYIRIPLECFKVIQQTNNTEDIKFMRPRSTPRSFEDGQTLTIQLDRALRDGEFKVKLHYLWVGYMTRPTEYNLVGEWIVSKEATVAQTKKEIIEDLKANSNIDVSYEKCRLRKKFSATPSKVLFDHQKFKDIELINQELIVQELPDKDNVTDPNQIVINAIKFLVQDSVESYEIALSNNTLSELATKLAELTGINAENLNFVKLDWINYGGYADAIDSYKWINLNDESWNLSTLEDGALIYYKDGTEENNYSSNEDDDKSKQNTFDERRLALDSNVNNMRDKTRRFRFCKESSYNSPRRERALKIYFDNK
ncbi:ubiquitin carboxyl-terminal hydrolase 47 isoform X1 [Cotesia glomerata]|uniref:Ubiquitin carboxyl-terminal hydrolase 47 n=2 Tax=Cotesia glomerata TaxID=32391 RepID=A0AAV7IXG1_COTGL|nr:ubiquitin carboxyl-terminal hydrolase 47 isoform X1 [Cotesia glomerata]XP_044598321.1 ubiquitin carboxyl-terminal hydrolase 47 isoform X1 [Cotesia glomerata]XP_044598322.1 ubiquitin carboxyl-terminal hydrolase 47 isoform X1 [Cotesia glomerata]XP_044598324.1 ubiquitin carboxyl-terminal hydrolase 47 isoform X1 [Cotesia glomerata]XP_044598325.1 ubiquitin carboxyl-terminal hydrolase 47 isoform X1 [Cotesia glomerata]XP_044598326.1 ubiquitin carboxyl-terminal hydrolase 47 isoform X1 [Cotesia glom